VPLLPPGFADAKPVLPFLAKLGSATAKGVLPNLPPSVCATAKGLLLLGTTAKRLTLLVTRPAPLALRALASWFVEKVNKSGGR
jgi:hypothetical protein